MSYTRLYRYVPMAKSGIYDCGVYKNLWVDWYLYHPKHIRRSSNYKLWDCSESSSIYTFVYVFSSRIIMILKGNDAAT